MVVRLEVFESEEAHAGAGTVVLDSGMLEEARLASYESGYPAGWEDAAAAQAGETTRMHAALSRNLQALSFTHQEARSHILRALEPLLEQMVKVLLPSLAREAVGGLVLDALMPMLDADDVVIEGGNSFWKDSAARAAVFAARGVHYLAGGTSGGVGGRARGYCRSLGGKYLPNSRTRCVWRLARRSCCAVGRSASTIVRA